jgi:hypothetical protein
VAVMPPRYPTTRLVLRTSLAGSECNAPILADQQHRQTRAGTFAAVGGFFHKLSVDFPDKPFQPPCHVLPARRHDGRALRVLELDLHRLC